MAVIVEAEKLLVEWRIVRQDAGRVVVDIDTAGGSLYDDTIFAIREDPMKFGGWKLGAERSVHKVHFINKNFCFGDGTALTENPRDKLKLGDIVAVGRHIVKNSVTSKK